MTDHGKEESEGEREGEEASASQGKARSRQEERCEEKRREEERPSCEEGEQSEGSQEGQESSAEEGSAEESSAEESSGEVREGCTAAQGRVGSEESDGTAETRCSGRTVAGADACSRAGQRLGSRAVALVDEHGSFRLTGDRQVSVERASTEKGCAPRCRRWNAAAPAS
jgi:hypothetical protein